MSFSKFKENHTPPELGKAFLDCGAFSVLTGQWEALPIDAYIKFVDEHADKFEIIAAPDVIGDAKATFANLRYFTSKLSARNRWDALKKKVIITYHLGDRDFDTLKNMLLFANEVGIEWVAIGGIVTPGTSIEQRFIGINEVIKQVRSTQHNFKVHLFGGYTPEYIRTFKPDSVDSSTYLQKARMLQLFRYAPETWKMTSISCPRTSTKEILDFVMAHFEPLYDLIGLTDKEKLRNELRSLPDGVKFWVVNGLYMRLFEQEVRKTIPNFRYWMTVASLDDGIRYGEYVSNFLFTKMWRNASLVAYPSFYDKSDFTVNNKLMLLK